MKEKKISTQESIAIINEMIRRSKTRRCIGDGNIMLLWGYLTVGVAALVWWLLVIIHNNAVNWLWFLIWIIGGMATPVMLNKRRLGVGVVTYTDKLSGVLWSIVGGCAIVMTLMCLGFLLIGGKDSWSVMLLLPLIIVGIVEIMQGVVIRERSLVWGGGVGLLFGLYTLCCIAGGIALSAYWFMPMFIISVAVMMILPGHILNYKSRHKK